MKDIRNEFLWLNPYIKVGRKSIFYQHWYTKGIKFICDILNAQGGDFIGTEELQEKINLQIYSLEYYSMRSAISGEWKLKL